MLSLDFTVTYTYQDKSVTDELKPNGSNISVTDENKVDYLALRLRHRMLESVKPQLQVFLLFKYEIYMYIFFKILFAYDFFSFFLVYRASSRGSTKV